MNNSNYKHQLHQYLANPMLLAAKIQLWVQALIRIMLWLVAASASISAAYIVLRLMWWIVMFLSNDFNK